MSPTSKKKNTTFLTLQAGCPWTLTLHVNPSITPLASKFSQTLHGRCTLHYPHHSHVDTCDLILEGVFPNLALSTTSLTMKPMPQDHVAVHALRLSNPGTLPTHFQWGLYDTPLFIDIVPHDGTLLPNEVLDIEVIVWGVEEGVHRPLLFVDAQGGPRYEVQLHCCVSNTTCEPSSTHVSFNVPSHLQVMDTELTLINKGHRASGFQVLFDPSDPVFTSLYITPHQGEVRAHAKEKLKLLMCPFYPGSRGPSHLPSRVLAFHRGRPSSLHRHPIDVVPRSLVYLPFRHRVTLHSPFTFRS
ncbi:hypothetical protein HMI54_010309 [Coelomomyces lativittatus]|nr:hypothetical protein HMI54_010309 [Coelomomyces lativittatus]